MVLIVNTSKDTGITQKLQGLMEREGIEADIVETKDMKISHCVGCNYCWLKTPGVCSIKDDYEEILKKIIKADQLWVVSDTALGFLDHKGKNIFDRILPIATMYLKFNRKQMRHVARYDKSPDVGLIVTGEADMDYLDDWVYRCAINFESAAHGAFTEYELEEAVSCMF